MSNQPAPLELTQIGLDRLSFQVSDSKSWRGPCPKCGGSRRFVIFTDHEYPFWNGFCDECGYKIKAWELIRAPIDTDSRRQWVREATKKELEQAERRRAKLAEFTNAELWTELHERMTLENYSWWDAQGIPKDWADFWQLGFIQEKLFEHNGESFKRPAYTIPKFGLNWNPTNIDYRIIDPPPGVGKYRPAFGLAAAAFYSRPDHKELLDEIIIVEGSKKAMVVHVWGGDGAGQVIGIPGCMSWAGVDKLVKDCGRVYVILDPDARAAAHKLAQAIGKAARLVTLPVKPDDALVSGMTRKDWQYALRQGLKI